MEAGEAIRSSRRVSARGLQLRSNLAPAGLLRSASPVMNGSLKNAALILVGHGSTLNAESSAPTYQHADELRRRQIFGQVRECFWKLEPSICGVLRGVFAPRVFVVPLFVSDGYFTEEVIPRELGFTPQAGRRDWRTRRHGEQTISYCEPVGTHDSMTDVLLARAADVVARHPFPHAPRPSDVTLFIAGHGTGNNENSRRAIEHQVERIRLLRQYADVHAVFMEEAPRIEKVYELASTRNIVMVPFFISDGLHSYEDIPVMLGEPERQVRQRYEAGQPTWRNPTEKNGKRVWYSASIGHEPRLAEVILERVQEMEVLETKAARPPGAAAPSEN